MLAAMIAISGSSSPVPGAGGGGAQPEPNYSTLDSYFDLFSPVTSTSIYQDTARTIPATDGTKVRSVTERKAAKHMQWISSENRTGYNNIKFGARYDLDYINYKFPLGDIPHITFPNYIDMLLSCGVTPVAMPVTCVMLVRRRRAVLYENMRVPGQIRWKENGSVIQIGNSVDTGVDVTGSSVHPEDVWSLIEVVINGSASGLYTNGVKNGSDVTIAAGFFNDNGHGTESHVHEHDFAFSGIKYGVYTAPERATILGIVNGLVPLNVRSSKPHLHSLGLTFNTDTWSVTGTFAQGSAGLPENTSLRQYSWIMHSTNAASSPNGMTLLDAIKPIFNHFGPTVKRSLFPSYFPQDGFTQELAVRVKGFNTAGDSLGAIEFRSIYYVASTGGTYDASFAPKVTGYTVSDSLKNAIDITYNAALNTSTGRAVDFTVYRNDVLATVTGITFPNSTTLRVTLSANMAASEVIRVEHRQTATTPLLGANGLTCESMVAGQFFNVINNIAGPQTVKANFGMFGNQTASPGWLNPEYDFTTTGVKGTNLVDILGINSGTGISVGDAWEDGNVNLGGGTPTVGNNVNNAGTVTGGVTIYPDANITARGPGLTSAQTGSVVITGLGAGKTVDVKIGFFKTAGGGGGGTYTGTAVGTGTTNFSGNCSTLTQHDLVGLVADGSGNLTITITNTGGSNGTVMSALIWTKYP